MNEDILTKAAAQAVAEARDGDPTLFLLISLYNEVQALRWAISPPKTKRPLSFGETARLLIEARNGNS